MPIQSPTFFIPMSLALGTGGLHPYETALTPPFLIEDIFFRGGFRCLPSIEIRDAIPIHACKEGMLVYTPEDGGKVWKIASISGNDVTWEELSLGGNYTGRDPIDILDSEIFIDPLRILPLIYDEVTGDPIANPGHVVALDADLKPAWVDASGAGFTGIREYETYTTAILDVLGADTEDFVLELGKVVLLLELSVDIPDILVEVYSREERSESNPYRFIATETMLDDRGITIQTDGSFEKHRRYSILANLEEPPTNKLYFRIRYLADTEASKDSDGAVIQYRQPTLNITYLVVEP